MNLLTKIYNDVYTIAEMSANHAGDIGNALEIVRAAKDAGADCLKVQTYTADSLTIDCDNEYFRIEGGLWDGYNLYDLYTEAAMPYTWQARIKEECEKVGIDFLSTPFDEEGVDFLEKFGVEAYKVASFELVHIPLLKHIARKDKPMIISCGMGSEKEIGEAVEAVLGEGLSKEQVILLKCTSEYPANYEDMNLLTIPDMEKRFGCRVGFSDHSMGSIAAVTAVSLGACIVEKHLCMSRSIMSPDSEFSMEPHEFTSMVKDIEAVVKLRGKVSYMPGETEKSSMVFRRSLFVVKEIQKGELFTKENVKCIRPSFGMKPKLIDVVLGNHATAFIKQGTPLCEELIEMAESPGFESERLTYREMNINDTTEVVRWRSDPFIFVYFRNPTPLTLAGHLNWYNTVYSCDSTHTCYIIKEKNSGCNIGTVSVLEREDETCELGYLIGDKAFHKRGYGTEALSALIDKLNSSGVTRFTVEIHNDNISSIGIAKKNGFSIENSGKVFSTYSLDTSMR